MEPTQRRALATGSPPNSGAPRVVPPRVSGAGGTDRQAVQKTSRGLGLSEEQVGKSLQPLATKKISTRERQIAHLKEQLHHLRVRIERQSEAVRKHTEQFQLMLAKFDGWKQEEAVMKAQYRELSSKKADAKVRLVHLWALLLVLDLQFPEQGGGDDAGKDVDHGLEGGLTPRGSALELVSASSRALPIGWFSSAQHGLGCQQC